ncbi:Jumonji and AT-rich interaction domain containing 2 [Homalodisca vitripennis]|nr:Jumonji and AT-rich interaction domain containing 2 [Homalodisca vitripennis]
MVVSRSDSKRRKKEEDETLRESPKRTKVHAQRKFAQGSHLNSPVMTPVKDKDKTKYNGTAAPAELLPVKRPKTEEFVNFLCFRESTFVSLTKAHPHKMFP